MLFPFKAILVIPLLRPPLFAIQVPRALREVSDASQPRVHYKSDEHWPWDNMVQGLNGYSTDV